MLIAALFKGLMLYIAFIVIRGLWRGYKTVSFIKAKVKQQQADIFEQQKGHQSSAQDYSRTDSSTSDALEAEFRVIKEEK